MRPLRRAAIVALAFMSAIALSNCAADEESVSKQPSAPPRAEDTFAVAGTVEVQAIRNGRPGAPCRPDEETLRWPARPGAQKSGVQVGGDVTVTDASGHVVGLGQVMVGEYMESGYDVSSYCAVPFQVEGVRGGDQFYGVAVADLPMERYARDELDQPIMIVVPDN